MTPGKHRANPDCPVCSPVSAKRRQQTRNRRQGGYSPAPRCPAHPLGTPARPPVAPRGTGGTSPRSKP